MRHILTFLFLAVFLSSFGQVNESKRGFLGFFKFKSPSIDVRWNKSPVLTTFMGTTIVSSFAYWQGSSYTTVSQNGRIQTTHLFDMQGQLRETRSSVSLRRSGILSYWRLQFSPQRTRPLLVYTIH